MSLILNLNDDEYPFDYISHTRIVVRGIVLNENNEVGLCVVSRDDIFGNVDYLETPGGGKEENESLIDGLIRELDEEIGYKCEVISELGIVNDYYNLIHRKNENHYYLCRIKEITNVHHVSKGDDYIKDIIWLDINEAIERYHSLNDYGLEKLVKNRELPILYEAKKIMHL